MVVLLKPVAGDHKYCNAWLTVFILKLSVLQTVVSAGRPTVIKSSVLTVMEPVVTQLFCVTVTVYTVVSFGHTSGLAVLASLIQVLGDQLYVIPLPVTLAMSGKVSMVHINVSVKGSVRLGLSLAVTVLLTEPLQPTLLPTFKVTVYVPALLYVCAGVFVDAVFVEDADSPKFQAQLFTLPYCATVASLN